MEFCRCFGLSSLQIVLKDLSISEFKTLLSYRFKRLQRVPATNKSSYILDTRYYLFSCDKRYCLYSLTSSSFISTANRSAIFSKLSISGCDVFVHHLLTVDGVTPNCSDSHLDVRFFSNSTIFILFISSINFLF